MYCHNLQVHNQKPPETTRCAFNVNYLYYTFVHSQPEVQAVVRVHRQGHPPRAPPFRICTSPLPRPNRTSPGICVVLSVSVCKSKLLDNRAVMYICHCCCHRDETGALSGDEASRNHGGISVAKRSDSPNSFLDQESRRHEEDEPVYCTTPTYGTLFGMRAGKSLGLGFI